MPELPEVETIKSELAPSLVGRRIVKVELPWTGVVRQPSPEAFRQGLAGRRVMSLGRRAKYLLAALDDGYTLIIHLKMSGALFLKKTNDTIDKYARAVIYFDDGNVIQFRDPRKFGRMWLVKDVDAVTGKLGPEPLEPGFTAATLAELLKKHRAPIKPVLLNQEILAGVGNMYADEALYEARLHPLRPANSLTADEVTRLFHAIRKVLRAGIASKGASVVNYYRPSGDPGTAHLNFRVAHRLGEPCPNCGGKIERIVVRGRGTYICPKCQKL